ncbi:MAG: hypothetical protein J6M31_07190 [Bacteroidales bacterium]|nr:hypothetical protein [Bacteroidales bacterium]
MKRFGIIGHPVAGSMSPLLFAAAYEGRYPYDLIEEASFETAWQRFLADYEGVNVTAPFKQQAFGRADKASEAATRCQAANLIVKTPDGLAAYNTDVAGVLESLRPEVQSGQKALVVGAGGAARAAIVAAQMLGLEVTVAGRTPSKTEALGREMGCRAIGLEEATSETPAVVIYTLPGSAPVPSGLPLSRAVVLEAEYKHPQLSSAPCRKYLSGRLWLVHQALSGYKLFTGKDPSVQRIWQTINTQ